MLIVIGLVLSVLWGMTTWVSLGVSPQVCHALGRLAPGFLYRAIHHMRNGFYYDVPNADMPTVIFLIIFSSAFLLYFTSIYFISKKPFHKKDLLLIVLFAIVFRAILLPSIPVHENDFYRYLWDGKLFKHGHNPFKYAPGDLESVENTFSRDYYDWDKKTYVKVKTFSEDQKRELARLNKLRYQNHIFFDRIGHRPVPTIYPPTAQWVFWISSVVREDSILFMKFLFVVFDVLVIFVLIGLLKSVKMNPSMVIVYAWSPLILKEFANSGHYDAVAIFFMMLAISWLIQRRDDNGVLALSLAGLTKLFPFLLTPLFMRQFKRKHFLALAGIVLACYLPFFFWDKVGVAGVFKGLTTYSQEWAYNGSLFIIIRSMLKLLPFGFLHGLLPAKAFCGMIFLAVLAFLSMKDNTDDLDLLKKVFILLGLLFLLNPVGDPWYYTWVIPLLCFFCYRSFLLLSWLLIFSYLSFNHDFGSVSWGYCEFKVLTLVQYVPFYLFLIVEIILKRRKKIGYV